MRWPPKKKLITNRELSGGYCKTAVSRWPFSQQQIKMENQNLEVGKIYDVVSQRKGKFRMQLTHHDETWASGIITKGKAKAILAYNEVEKGEEVTVRKSFTTFTAVS